MQAWKSSVEIWSRSQFPFSWNYSVIHINLLSGNCLQRFNSHVRKTKSKSCFLSIICKVCKLLAFVSYMVALCRTLIKSLFSHFHFKSITTSSPVNCSNHFKSSSNFGFRLGGRRGKKVTFATSYRQWRRFYGKVSELRDKLDILIYYGISKGTLKPPANLTEGKKWFSLIRFMCDFPTKKNTRSNFSSFLSSACAV